MKKIFKSKFLKSLIRFSLSPFVERRELKKGVSALVCCRDEEFNITLCLESLVGLVDQIICIDHNSSDETYNKMISFQEKYNGRLDITVQQFNKPELKEARNFGLQFVKYKWLLKCDGDFVFDIEKPEVSNFFQTLKKSTELASYKLSFVNLMGDLKHTYKNAKVIETGENYVIRMTKNVYFDEDGKFDYIKIPVYYKHKSISTPFFFHLSGMKNDMRLIYRNCYFEWRETLNFLKSKGVKDSPYFEYDYFSNYWNDCLFQTNEINSLKYRYMRQLCELNLQRFDENKFHPYPKVIKDMINSNYERFEIKYKDNIPFIRIDREDEDMKLFIPSSVDLNWSIEEFREKIYSKEYLNKIKSNI
jgi:hypothetical protein